MSATEANNLRQSEGSGIPAWKRALDLFCVFLAAPVLLPAMALMAVLIKSVSPGPALFKQIRIGYKGHRFTCFKFRTMYVNADTGVHQQHLNNLIGSKTPMKKLDAVDRRIIPGGRLLRSLGLDELPQIFNVVRGEMSLVGPRPCIPYEYEGYTAHQRQRFEAAPGLTGLWQVSGKNRTTFDQMIEFDILYARKRSLGMDLKIIFKTVPALMAQTKDLNEDSKAVFQKPSLEQR